jgi:hypothetical protein
MINSNPQTLLNTGMSHSDFVNNNDIQPENEIIEHEHKLIHKKKISNFKNIINKNIINDNINETESLNNKNNKYCNSEIIEFEDIPKTISSNNTYFDNQLKYKYKSKLQLEYLDFNSIQNKNNSK